MSKCFKSPFSNCFNDSHMTTHIIRSFNLFRRGLIQLLGFCHVIVSNVRRYFTRTEATTTATKATKTTNKNIRRVLLC